MNHRSPVAAALVILFFADLSAASEPLPTALSPGSTEKIEQIGDSCPTFSWSGVPQATAYELEVFEVAVGGILDQRIIQKSLQGSASAWTPPLRQCLSRGKLYAWTVGAIAKDRIAWSEPALFELAAGPTEEDFRIALQTVQEYLGTGDQAGETDPAPATEQRAASSTKMADQKAPRPQPAPRKRGSTFGVDSSGNVVATSFTGDGSALSGIVSTGGGTITGDLDIEQNLDVGSTITTPTLILNGETISDLSSVTEPTVYTPACLTCGSNAESSSAQWGVLASGTFKITLEGTSYDIVVNFVGVANMDDVAMRIQDAINTATGGSETCTWDTDHFVIKSGDTTVNSSIVALETHGGAMPLDISGAGTNDWMDCDAGNSTVTKKELDTSFYQGSLVRLDSNGLFNTWLMPELLSGSAANEIFQETGFGIDGGGPFTFDIPIGFMGATHFRMFYHMYVVNGNSNPLQYSARTGIMEGKLGGQILDIFSDTINTTSFAVAQGTTIEWSDLGGVTTIFQSLQVNAATELIIDSIEAHEDNVRITLSVPTGSMQSWNAVFKCKGIIAFR